MQKLSDCAGEAIGDVAKSPRRGAPRQTFVNQRRASASGNRHHLWGDERTPDEP
jgi:hypothetical protein